MPPVSIILTVHNQFDELKAHLRSFLEQDYGQYEVVVVDHASTDNTGDLLKAYELKYPHLRHTTIHPGARYISTKRLELTIGFKSALYDWCLVSEAGCRPVSSQWLREMSKHFLPDVTMVLGYGNYAATRHLLHRKAAFFNLYHQLHYLHWALRRRAYRANPINMAYRKSFFLEHKGFAEDINLTEGAMELLVNRHSTHANTRVCLSPEAKVEDCRPVSTERLKKEQLYYMETRKHFVHTQAYRCAFNIKQWIVPLFHLCTIAALACAVSGRQWKATTGVAVLFLAVTVLKTVLFNRSIRCLGAHPRFLDLWFGEWTIPFSNLSSWFRYRMTPKRHFRRKAF